MFFLNCQPKHNPNGVIPRYSKTSISDAVNSLLVKVPRFSLSPNKLIYADYLPNFELFYRRIPNLDVLSDSGLAFAKIMFKDAALSSFCFYNAKKKMFFNIHPMTN